MSETFINILYTAHECFECNLPSRMQARQFIQQLLDILFPHFLNRKYRSTAEIEEHLDIMQKELHHLLQPLHAILPGNPTDLSEALFADLPKIYELLLKDAEAILQGDPAAYSRDEVILTYPGFYAIAVYRIAHALHALGVRILPRVLTEFAHARTGIDIHPGARIGSSFCIDHGTGLVIGETTEIGDHVKIYQGVTLGALSVDKSMANTKRHPTIEDHVVIYAGASILGGETVVGHHSIIGGNVWLTESVPPYTTVYHKADVKVKQGSPKEK